MIPKQTIAGCGDASCEMLVNPIPRPKPKEIKLTLRPRRRRVAMLDHGKPNSMAIFQRTAQILRDRGIEVASISRKASATTWMGESVLKRLSGEEGLVVCGISDCGSCSAGSSLDAVSLQERGIAGIPVLTAPFEDVLERVLTYYATDQRFPVIVLDHPTQNVSPETLQARAEQMAAQIERLLPDA